MAVFRPFAAVRPLPDYAAQVAALPYDVMSSAEARELAQGNPNSFLHVDKAEIDLDPSIDLYDARVYEKARENLEKLVSDGICAQDQKPCFYIYRQIMEGRAQTGLVGCASIDDYRSNTIKKHEFTRADKEADRIRHVDACDANTGPIFLACRPQAKLHTILEDWKAAHAPVYDFVQDGVRQTVWVVDDDSAIVRLTETIAKIEALYIADGHHRAASAVRVGEMRREATPGYTGEEEFNFFLAVLFSSDELAIMDYNRVVKDLNGYTQAEFLQKIGENSRFPPMRGRGRSTRSKAIPSAYIWAENGIAWRQRQARSLKAIRLRASMYPFCRRTCLALCSASVTRARINVLTLSAAFAALGSWKSAQIAICCSLSLCVRPLWRN